MKPEMIRPARLRKWLLVFLFWNLVAIVFITQAGLDQSVKMEVHWRQIALWEFAGWYIWAALSPAILRLSRRLPLSREHFGRHLAIHLFAGSLFAILQASLHMVALKQLGTRLLDPPVDLAADFSHGFVTRVSFRVLVYLIILITCQFFDSQRKIQEEEQKASALEIQLANAQLQALKMQLNPHFLFNTLNSISELMHQNLQAADEMMVRLADFLRLTLDNSGSQEVTIDEELQFLESYLDIEKIRFKQNLQVNIHVDPDVRKARIPNLILQPIVENAIIHGVSQSSDPGIIEIRALKNDGKLQVQILDNGPGLENDEQQHRNGLGLNNTRERLEKMYGNNQRLILSGANQKGLMVTIEIPFALMDENNE